MKTLISIDPAKINLGASAPIQSLPHINLAGETLTNFEACAGDATHAALPLEAAPLNSAPIQIDNLNINVGTALDIAGVITLLGMAAHGIKRLWNYIWAAPQSSSS